MQGFGGQVLASILAGVAVALLLGVARAVVSMSRTVHQGARATETLAKTVADLADKLDETSGRVDRLETGRRRPPGAHQRPNGR